MSDPKLIGGSVARIKRPYPKGVWLQPKRLSDGVVIRYGYYGRGPGAVALGREGSPEFFQRLADAMRKEPPGETVSRLVWRYRKSDEFAKLKPRTQADYLQQLGKITEKFGVLSLRAMSSREIVPHLYAWRKAVSASDRRADYAIQVLKALLAWGARHGHLDHNRAAGIERRYSVDRSERVWTEDQVAALMASAGLPIRTALLLAIETGQSQTDLLTMPWSAVNGPILEGRRKKTGVPIAVPISPRLRAALDAAPSGRAVTILTRPDGLPWEPKGNGFRAAWRDAAKSAGLTGITFNDLRGTFITRRREAGWTEEEVALCSGHPMAKRGAFHAYVDRGAVARANALQLAARFYEAVA